ncbi:MAG: FkbM family methyltransferase [Chloroflexi bacterium]|nr:FkbM family methyltransferase [Chloroflexota bacterium]
MKIVFVAHNEGRLRHFGSVIRMLAERGHTVSVTTRDDISIPVGLDHPRVRMRTGPTWRVDEWRDLVGPVRRARDYVRYLAPRYANARLVRWQAARKVPGGFPRWCESRPWVWRHWRMLLLALKTVEDLIPSDRAFEAFLESEQPDIVLVTPLVQHGSYQTDYVKSAHRLGLTVGLPVFSWDNLSTQGLIRILPDRVLVWNATQKWEAVALHGVPAERVVVTGAPRFDDFFAMGPTTTREEFCALTRLDPARPFILYIGSAPFVARRELDFVRRWVQEVRTSSDPTLQGCGVLIRPYPETTEAWAGEDMPNVAVYRDPHKVNADPELYDSIYHATIVVGLNTSAMIQAGILGKPVHTIIVPQLEGQEGLLHFEYLVRAHGGLLSVAHGFEEHRQQLADALRSDAAGRARSLHFVEGFVRPHGLDVAATPIMVREIERLAEIRKRPRRPPPLWHAPMRRVVGGWLRARLSDWLARRERHNGSTSFEQSVPAGRDGEPDEPSAPMPRRESPRRDHVTERAVANVVSGGLHRLGLADGSELFSEVTGALAESAVSADSGRHRVRKLDYERHKIYLRLTPNAVKRWLRPCLLEPFAVGWIESFVRPGDVFYDIGAHVGTYSLIAAKFTRGEASVFAIEPAFSAYSDLCRNVVLNGCDESITPLPVALAAASSREGARCGAPNSDVLGRGSGQSARGRGESAAATTWRLDDLVGRFDLPTPSHIRLDIGGAELGVLQGAVDALDDPKLRSLLVYVEDYTARTTREAEICRLLASKGFRLRSEHRTDDRPGRPPYCVFSRR